VTYLARDYSGVFKPRPDSTRLSLPITMDYKGGRAEKTKNRVLWVLGWIAVTCVICFGLLTSKDGTFLVKLVRAIAVSFISITILRFGYLDEGKLRNEEIKLQDSDYQVGTYATWGILTVRENIQGIPICQYRNGRSGVFVRMEKNVFKGDKSASKFRHREAVGNFFNLLARTPDLKVSHIDMMDFVGSDERIDLAIESTKKCSNPLLKKWVYTIYRKLKEDSQYEIYASDIFIFTWTGNNDLNMQTVQNALGFLQQNAGYIGYEYMGMAELGELYKVLFNVVDFDTTRACTLAQGEIGNMGITPLKVIHGNGGVDVINLSREEKLQQRDKESMRSTQGYNGPVDTMYLRDKHQDDMPDSFEI
jgi:hypothetical protein